METILDDLESKACANLSCPVTFRRPREVIPVSPHFARDKASTGRRTYLRPETGHDGIEAGRSVKIPKIK